MKAKIVTTAALAAIILAGSGVPPTASAHAQTATRQSAGEDEAQPRRATRTRPPQRRFGCPLINIGTPDRPRYVKDPACGNFSDSSISAFGNRAR